MNEATTPVHRNETMALIHSVNYYYGMQKGLYCALLTTGIAQFRQSNMAHFSAAGIAPGHWRVGLNEGWTGGFKQVG